MESISPPQQLVPSATSENPDGPNGSSAPEDPDAVEESIEQLVGDTGVLFLGFRNKEVLKPSQKLDIESLANLEVTMQQYEEEYQFQQPASLTSAKTTPIDLDSLSWYQYSPLPTFGRPIRLLKMGELQISMTDGALQRICSLESFDLDDCPPYLALSYTWGLPLNTTECSAEYDKDKHWVLHSTEGPRRIQIRRNLFEGLRRITQANSFTTYIWIDALCICQTDRDERESQVRLMTDIYRGCKRVIVWLGGGGPELEDFVSLHEILAPRISRYLMDNGRAYIEQKHWDKEEFYHEFRLAELHGHLNWTAFTNFYSQTCWFSRAWIVQEIVNAPKITVLCGQHTIIWEGMLLLATFLHDSRLGSAFLPFSGDSQRIIPVEPGAKVCVLNGMRSAYKGLGSAAWLKTFAERVEMSTLEETCYAIFFHFIMEMRKSKASDPRDKIYAALGFLETSLPAGVQPIIRPNYSAGFTVQEAYIEASTTLLLMLPNLWLLSEVGDPSLSCISGLPSWVPDFSYENIQSLRSTALDPYNASGDAQKPLRSTISAKLLTIQGSTLILRGACFDTIKSVIQFKQDWLAAKIGVEANIMRTSELIMSWLRIISTANLTPKSQSPTEVLWRTMVAGRPKRNDLPPISKEVFHDFILHWLLQVITIQEIVTTARFMQLIFLFEDLPSMNVILSLMTFRTEDNPNQEVSADKLEKIAKLRRNAVMFSAAYGRNTSNRKLLLTEQGRLGMGPVSMKEGDRVCMIRGAELLFVLRPADGENTFTLIGEAYVHGCMDGELVDVLKDDLKPIRII